MALKLNFPTARASSSKQGFLPCRQMENYIVSVKPKGMCQFTQPHILCAMNMTAGRSDESGKLKFDHIVHKAKQLWDGSPQPVKSFPWNRAFDNFIQLILDTALVVIKYLSLPIFAVSCLSEMSYCAHERKLYFVPLPFLVGAAVAGILRTAALESSPSLKNAEVPWHLIAVAIFFTLIKWPGPYYPYWGRLLIPHFANGALLRTLWFTFLWYRRPKKSSETTVGASTASTEDTV
ncbi:uncharacterized protein [Coffea arabica]|uniref:Uncharacterized protein isoform X2 n=1 Tax=Coffea arabica TaxID=13443 RepID=A0A6P6WEP9_COFAR|nr:uncharacterized protein LOC113731372 isoform X1 [Coffea arabica]